ncbi:unnamed protein product [Ceutorhynchus assimilis]|uniref:Anticodon-binding domain-containing protein n=1 Tax=Ceutorhynchus assimilis TaxID=467358 RepID=A0A9N9MY19_9CUCU|nr:unnamed protein product [Ceutorhynchus assimilis]
MFNAVISLCEKHGFLKKIKLEQLKVGPTGCLLMQNLKNEWFHNTVTNKDISVFLSDNNDFRETLEFAKNMCLDRLPFGIAEIINTKSSAQEFLDYYTEKAKDNIDFQNLFGNDRVTLKCTIFTAPSESIPFFHQWQRHRRIWWRKFSPNPGIYSLSDIKTDNNNIQSVQIMANYPWGSQLIESLALYPKPKGIIDHKFKFGKKSLSPHTVVSNIDMSSMFINTLCDAYAEPEYKDTKRTLLRFHRKLAPYSISFSIASGLPAGVSTELNDLALYLTRQLRTKHVSTLFLPSSSKLSLDAQWRQYDELGIPYGVLLNEKTLKDGLVLLRSRDTTLKEQVHVTDLVSYVEQLFKNY